MANVMAKKGIALIENAVLNCLFDNGPLKAFEVARILDLPQVDKNKFARAVLKSMVLNELVTYIGQEPYGTYQLSSKGQVKLQNDGDIV